MWDHKGHFRYRLAKSQEHDSRRGEGTFELKYRGDACDYGDKSNTNSAYI